MGVAATHTAGSMVVRAGPRAWPRGRAHFLLSSPLRLCAVGSGGRKQNGAWPNEQELASSQWEVQRVRWRSICSNGQSVKRTPTYKARGQAGAYFCPQSRNRVLFPGDYGAYKIFSAGRLVEGRTRHGTGAHFPPSWHPPPRALGRTSHLCQAHIILR